MMSRRIEIIVQVDESHRGTIQFPADIPAGVHKVVAFFEDNAHSTDDDEDFPVLTDANWIEGLPMTRDEIYGSDEEN